MQYLLSREEYDDLKSTSDRAKILIDAEVKKQIEEYRKVVEEKMVAFVRRHFRTYDIQRGSGFLNDLAATWRES